MIELNYNLENIVYFCEQDNFWKTEVFKDVKGYEGSYQVSDIGRVKSLDREVNHVFGKRKVKARILKEAILKMEKFFILKI